MPLTLLIVRGDQEIAGVDTVGRRRRERDRPADSEDDAGRRTRSAEIYGGRRIGRERERPGPGEVEARAADRHDRIVGADQLVARRGGRARTGHIAATACQRAGLVDADDLAGPCPAAGQHEVAEIEILLELDRERLEDPGRRRGLSKRAYRPSGCAEHGEHRCRAKSREEIPHVSVPTRHAPTPERAKIVCTALTRTAYGFAQAYG